MKIINKFKNYSREIKLIIITVLIASCIGVYAAGTCIISATADDVTYGNTTVQAAIDELYSMSEEYCPAGFVCTENNYALDCDNKKHRTTIPSTLNGLARIMAESAYLDDAQSEYVTSCDGVNFNAISSDTNGKGIYEIAKTKDDDYPIYYYRGVVDNNVKFAGFCWKAIRTTDTGGVKLIYNGTPNGSGNCTNTTGSATEISKSSFYTSIDSPAYIGYMYGPVYNYNNRVASDLNVAYKYGNDVTFSNGTYTLTNTMTSTGNWSTDYNTLNNNHYTCFSTGTTCTSVYYVYSTDSSNGAYYVILSNGKKANDALNDMFTNTTESTAKTVVDNWYSTNLSSYTSYIEDTVYCNDRSISDYAGWDPNGGDTTNYLKFSSNYRAFTQNPSKLSVSCSRIIDRFTVSSTKGNGELTYPVGLITSDELKYAGSIGFVNNNSTQNTSFYLYTNSSYWTMSPGASFHEGVTGIGFCSATINTGPPPWNSYGIRPVISLKPTTVVASGDGTSTNPYVIQTS